MNRILVAGATGYLGRHICKALQQQGHWVRALSRKKSLHRLGRVDDVVVADITQPESLEGVCTDIDFVISCLGKTRQTDKASYEDVDYQGNLNVLAQAKASQVKGFLYVHVLNAHLMNHVPGVKAKQRFVEALKASGIAYKIVSPTGYFSDMEGFLTMAKNGRGFLFGNGMAKINPIAGEDLANFCVAFLFGEQQQASVGGPEIYSYRQLAEYAFESCGRKPKIVHLPLWFVKPMFRVVKAIAPESISSPLQFFLTVATHDMVGESYGYQRLPHYFDMLAKRQQIGILQTP